MFHHSVYYATAGRQGPSETSVISISLITAYLGRMYVAKRNLTSSRYLASEQIGEGGMGIVSRATDQTLGRSVAMKVLRNPKHRESQARFIREATVLAQLEHPNIVPIHDLGRTEDGSLFYAMKMVRGQTLSVILSQIREGNADAIKQYPLATLLRIFRKVCDAIAFAHQCGVVHRDLKPPNIMVGAFGEVLVMDWGLAKVGKEFASLAGGDAATGLDATRSDATGSDATQLASGSILRTKGTAETIVLDARSLTSGTDNAETKQGRGTEGLTLNPQDPTIAEFLEHATEPMTIDGIVVGTPHFMSPEQARGEHSLIDGRADIYSLGAILYNILTLRSPIEGDSLPEILDNVISGRISPFPNNASSERFRKRNQSLGNDGIVKSLADLPHCPGRRIPAALSAIAMHALAVEPKKRYPSVDRMLTDIDAYESGFAASAQSIGFIGQAWLLIKRHRIVSASLAVILVISLFFVTKLIESERRANRNAELAQREAEGARDARDAALLAEAKARQSETAARESEADALEAESGARVDRENTRIALGQATLALAEAAWLDGNAAGLEKHLEACPPDLRNGKWQYLDRQLHSRIATVDAVQGRPVFFPGNDQRPPAFVAIRQRNVMQFLSPQSGTPIGKRKLPGVTASSERTLAFSADGNLLAYITDQRKVFVFNNDRQIQTVEFPRKPIAIAFTPDNVHLLVKSNGRELHCLEIATKEILWTVKRGGFSQGAPLGSFAVDPTGQYAAAHFMNSDQAVWILDLKTGERIRQMQTGNNFIWDLKFSRDGKWLAAGDFDGYATVWEVQSGVARQRIHAGNGRLTDLNFTFDNHLITLCRESEQPESPRRLRLWEIFNGTAMDNRIDLPTSSRSMAVDPNNGYVLVSGPRGVIFHFPIDRPEHKLETLFGEPVAFLGDNHLLSGSRGRRGYGVYDLAAADEPQESWYLNDAIAQWKQVATDPGRQRLLIGSNDHRNKNSLRRLQLLEGGSIEEVKTPSLPFTTSALDLGRDGSKFVLFGRKRQGLTAVGLMIDWEQWKPLKQFEVPENSLCVWTAFLDEDRKIVGMLQERGGELESHSTIHCWDANTQESLRTFVIPQQTLCAAASADGNRFALAGDEKSVTIYDGQSLRPVIEIFAHDGAVTALAFHPSQPIIATASTDLSVKLWHAETGQLLRKLLGPVKRPQSLAFNSSGSRLVCGASDRTTRVWKVDAQNLLESSRQNVE